MHHAATGATQGPIRGVVEDVADVRARADAASSRLAAAEECLRDAVDKLPVHELITHDDVDEDTGEYRTHDEHPSDCKACLWIERARAFLAGGKP